MNEYKNKKKAFYYVEKYGVTLPYEILKWKKVKLRFREYAKHLEERDYTVFCIPKRKINGIYNQISLTEDCRRIIAGERKILFYENADFELLDPKYRWEKDRMQHLYPLAILISMTRQKDAVSCFIHEIIRYVNNNHIENTNAMEIAIDSINLIVSYQIAALEDVEIGALISQEIKNNLIYILRNIENGLVFSNNHYFFDLLGVLWITAEIKQVAIIQRLHVYAEKEMKKLLSQIISEDGSLYEGSTYYTRYVAEALSEYVYYHPDEYILYTAVLQRLMSFLQGIANNGMIVGIGDNDSGRVLPIHSYFLYHSRNIQQITEMTQKFGLHAKKQSILGHYPDMGMLVIKRKDCMITLRCDTIKNKKRNRVLGGHEHNDQLSVQVTIGETPVVVDPGTYLYIPKDDCRINNMRTEFHNTLFFEGIEQNPITNDWNYEERGAVARIEYANEQMISAMVCYADIEHHRTVMVNDHIIEISDKYKANQKGTLAFVLAPTFQIVSEKGKEILLFSEFLEITFKSDAIIKVDRAFYAEEYGTREETIRLIMNVENSSHTFISWKENRRTGTCKEGT